MLNFYIFFVCLILGSSIYSLKDWKIYHYAYTNFKFYRFENLFKMKIANDGAKNEFIVFSDFNYKINYETYLQFDIWTLLDFHKLYWIFKFRSRAKNMGLV
jgi:hypothetical protein